MSSKKKNKTPDTANDDRTASAPDADRRADEPPRVETGGWVEHRANVERREFPGGSRVDEPLRLAFSAGAHAEILAHAESDVSRELCGVLLGTICEDSQGHWVSAEVALRGETDKQGGTHVTYTHKTWEKIYEQKDKKYPDLAILGWYHTHPGFGVQFSEMDLFIQRNFFPGDTQFALVVDPLSGDEAIIANTAGDTPYVSRFWINGKERQGQVPRAATPAATENADVGAVAVLVDRLSDVEARLAQVLQAAETQRESHGRLFLASGFLCVLLVAGCIAYILLDKYRNEHSPPKDLEMVNVPVKINGKVMMIGMQVKGWEIPDSENLLRNIEADAEQRAFQRAMQILLAREREGGELPTEAAEPMLSPTFTYYWALVASLVAVALLLIQFFPKGSQPDT